MGVVLAAYDPELDRKVALKLIRPEAQSDNNRGRMVREARAMAKLAHANVISVFDAGEHEGAVYIAMEFVEGTTLADTLEQPRSVSAVLDLFIPAARGLQAAHEIGLVHRDFKPENVMVGDDGRLLVMDFGLARSDGEPEESAVADEISLVTDAPISGVLDASARNQVTRFGSVMGTPGYMAPEQFKGAAVDGRADQFAFCVSLWEGLYGEPPYAGEGVWELAAAISAGTRQPVPAGRAAPRWLHAVIERGLAVEPDERWPDMKALLDAIARGRARRKKGWLTGAVVVPLVLGAVGYGGWRAWVGQVTSDCEEQARAAMTWPDRAPVLEAAMLGTNKSYAAQTYATAANELDEWSESWVELRRDVCVDAAIERRLEPEVNAAQASCLDGSVRSTTMLLETLTKGHPEQVMVAVEQVRATTILAPCRDLGALARRSAPDPAAAPAVDAAEDELREMTMLTYEGRYDEALERGRAALSLVEPTEFEAGIADAESRVGSLLSLMGRTDEARSMLERAYFRAGTASEDDVAARAARFLVGIGTAAEPHGIEWVRAWASHATMLHGRLGLDDELEQAEVFEALAVALAYEDQSATVPEEIRLLQQARDIRVAKSGTDHPAVLVAELNLASYEADQDPSSSLERFHQLGDQLREVLGPGHPEMATLMIMLGSIEAERGSFADAMKHLDDAVKIASESLGPEHPSTAQARQIREDVIAMAKAEP